MYTAKIIINDNYNRKEEIKKALESINKSINILFDYYQKGYIDITELDRRCNETMNFLFKNIYLNTNLSISEITDYISDVKISTYSKLANLYKERAKERKIN